LVDQTDKYLDVGRLPGGFQAFAGGVRDAAYS
jgi:hypothetical protein